MDELIIISGKKRIAIKDDEGNVTGEVCFNPSDVNFAERFYSVYQEFQAKIKEYELTASEIDAENKKADGNGVPAQFSKSVAFSREVCEFIYSKIDELFGAGTSQIVFRGSLDFEMIGQFFEGIAPFIQKARAEKLARYSNKPSKRVMK